ncbi:MULTISPECIES: DUF4080 domain-containing protein [unclassified Clostridium]|uniref:B12-binding domain-containing radical SAM protein n=1 Tax=unclassified Clostridium TaxID=2614128 RepID=UPI00110738A6|nr:MULTISPECIES: DUF4080 domain-containing protein [unclassified Clostridium]
MKILLAAVNAKYIHSNLGIYSLKAYADQAFEAGGEGFAVPSVELAEYTINHQLDLILQDIYRREPDVIAFSCYIWNIEYIRYLAADLGKILPDVPIWLGGPEVSFDAEGVLRSMPEVTGIMKGEGEETFAQLTGYYVDKWAGKEGGSGKRRVNGQAGLENIPGLAFRLPEGSLADTGIRPAMDMSRIPFPYKHMDIKELEHRIIYYESSRGCPFSCSYCLSSIDKSVRFRSLELVFDELSCFLEARVPQVKFVDRTFNCNKKHAMAIWQFIRRQDNGVTNFHFEIAADLLDEEEIELLGQMRPGLVQLEIGVQSTNPATLKTIRRKTDIGGIRRITGTINRGHNVHQHLDLIAGLPHENLECFRHSFNQVYSMEPEQLQLGFLKVLKGSYMEEMASSYELRYSSRPPYEVLSTRWLSYRDILELKGVEDMVEVYYNSRQFVHTLTALAARYGSPYEMFLDMAAFYRENRLAGISHSRIARYEILYSIIARHEAAQRDASVMEMFRDLLMYDLYLRENVKSRPSFARDQSPYKQAVRAFFQREEESPRYLMDYEGYDSRQMSKMAHIEAMGDGSLVLFDYRHRDPLTYNARADRVQ